MFRIFSIRWITRQMMRRFSKRLENEKTASNGGLFGGGGEGSWLSNLGLSVYGIAVSGVPSKPAMPHGLLSCPCYTLRGVFDEGDDRLWLRYIHRMAALDLDHRRTGAFGHCALGIRRNHPVLGRDQIPAWLRLPSWLADRAPEGFDSPRHL